MNDQIDYSKIKIHYPDKTIKAKWLYIARGFKELGVTLIPSSKMWDYSCSLSKNGIRGIYPLEVYIGDKLIKSYCDLGDPPKCYPSILEKGDVYFKIQYEKKHKEYAEFNGLNMFGVGISVNWVDLFFDNRERLLQLSNKRKYNWDLFGVFGATNWGTRLKGVTEANKIKCKSHVKLCPKPGKPAVPEEIKGSRTNYIDHLQEQCMSKICLSIPGNGYNCFRQTEILGLGGMLVMVEPDDYILYPNSSLYEGCCVFVKKDFSDLEEKVLSLLGDNAGREEMALRGLELYNEYLTPAAVARDMIDKIIMGV